MNKKEIKALRLIQDFKDTLENEIASQQTQNRTIKIKDIKFVGEVMIYDEGTGKNYTENVFIVEKQIIETDETGEERVIEQDNYYLGDECIGGAIGDKGLIYRQDFQINEPEKAKKIDALLEETPEEKIEENSLENLEEKEKEEVLLTQDEAEEIKVRGIQKADLNELVDGRETLGQRLDLEEYDSLYIVYSDKVNEVTQDSKINNTTYSLVGMKKDGQAKVLNEEFEMDRTVGNNATSEQTKIKADGTATRNSKDSSVYTRKSNGASIGCENNQGNVDMFLYQRTLEENENVGVQIETSQTPIIQIQTKEIMDKNKGIYQQDKVKDEVEEHIENECSPSEVKDYDGIEETSTHQHVNELEACVKDIYNFENEQGEEKIKEVFTEKEVKDKLIREIEENGDELSIQQIVQNVKDEMNRDAEMFEREHKM